MDYGLVALRALLAIVAATIGGLLALGKHRISHRTLCGLVSIAAGALLAVTVRHLVPESYELAGPGLLLPTVSLVGGTLVFAGISKYVYYLCPACAASATECDSGSGYVRLGILLMVAMSIHSTVDGLAISAGSAAAHNHGAPIAAWMILFAVAYHKVPEGMALSSLARLAGYSRAKALVTTILIEMTTAVGAFIGMYFLHGMSDLWLGITLGLVAGSFVYTVGFALLKEMYAHERTSILVHVGIGFVSILAIGEVIARLGISVH